MKKLMLGGAILLVMSVGNIATADTTSAPANENIPNGQIQLPNAEALYSTKVNEIDVPFEVLTYAHTQHLGYAVTDASKVNRAGEAFYKLKLERDIGSDASSNIYLYYNMEWWLIDEADMPKPQPRPQPTTEDIDDETIVAPEPTEEEAPEPQPQPEPETPKPEKPEEQQSQEPVSDPEPETEPNPEPVNNEEPVDETNTEEETTAEPQETDASEESGV